MNPRHWRHFLKIADLRNLSRAAEALNVSQSVLSREVRDLESGFGVKLLDRTSRGVRLTASGDIFARRAEAILRDADMVAQALRIGSQTLSGWMSIGLPPSLSGVVGGPVIEAMRAHHPGLRLQIREGTAGQICDGLIARDIDIGVFTTPVADARLQLHVFAREPIVVLGPADAQLDPTHPVRSEDVASFPLILAKRPNSVRLLLEQAVERSGRSLDVVIEAESAPIGPLVHRGLGYSAVPGSYVQRAESAGLPWAPIDGLAVEWAVGWARAMPISRTSAAFVKILATTVRQAIRSKSWNAHPILFSDALDE